MPVQQGKGAFATSKHVGNIGNNVLRHFVIYLDYAKQQIILEKGDNFDFVFPTDKSGLQCLVTKTNEIEVAHAAPATPAHKAGFQMGDIILAINGINVEYLDGVLAVRNLLREDAGVEYSVMVKRGADEKELKLKLANLH